MIRVRAITFDLDDTLWDIDPVIRGAEARVLAWLARNCPRVAERYGSEGLRALREEIARECPHLAHDFTRLRHLSLQRALDGCGYPRAAADAAFTVFIDARHEVRVHDDVVPALRRLAGRYRLGCITNGNASVVRLGLDRFFTSIVTATDTGVSKPHPEIFHRACRMLSLPPEQVLHVGDDPVHDVAGARGAGLAAVWLRRDGAQWIGESEPPARVGSLAGLVRLLEGRSPGASAQGTAASRTPETDTWTSHGFLPSPAPRGARPTTRS